MRVVWCVYCVCGAQRAVLVAQPQLPILGKWKRTKMQKTNKHDFCTLMRLPDDSALTPSRLRTSDTVLRFDPTVDVSEFLRSSSSALSLLQLRSGPEQLTLHLRLRELLLQVQDLLEELVLNLLRGPLRSPVLALRGARSAASSSIRWLPTALHILQLVIREAS